MKILVSIIAAVLFVTTKPTSTEKVTITATVINMKSNKGKVNFVLYNKETFMKKPLQAKSAVIKDGKSTVSFKDIVAGDYAIICYHDKNSNGTMDFESNGMPKEDYGASNNVMSFGPPQYDDAKFTVSDKDVSLEIKF